MRPLAAVSLKAYLDPAQTMTWLGEVREVAAAHPEVEVVVLPSLIALAQAIDVLAGVAAVGSQHVSPFPAGAYTGDVPAAHLAAAGARYVEVAHAERRRHHGEGDAQFAAEIEQALRHGLTPIVCVGEPKRCNPADALSQCLQRLDMLLASAAQRDVVIAYEPEWAIGADRPAPADHVIAVAAGLKDWATTSRLPARVIYGGTAGPGTYTELTPAVDGLFLGRRAHAVAGLEQAVLEMSPR